MMVLNTFPEFVVLSIDGLDVLFHRRMCRRLFDNLQKLATNIGLVMLSRKSYQLCFPVSQSVLSLRWEESADQTRTECLTNTLWLRYHSVLVLVFYWERNDQVCLLASFPQCTACHLFAINFFWQLKLANTHSFLGVQVLCQSSDIWIWIFLHSFAGISRAPEGCGQQ